MNINNSIKHKQTTHGFVTPEGSEEQANMELPSTKIHSVTTLCENQSDSLLGLQPGCNGKSIK